MNIVGRKAPIFRTDAAIGQSLRDISLLHYQIENKWVVLFFYPLDFTFVCPTEIVSLSDRISEFEALNTQVLGVSVDSVHTHLAWMRTPRSEAGVGEISFPLLSDLDKSISEDYGVLHEDKSLRGTFLIDPDGTVQSCTINNLPVGRNVDEILRTIQAYQYVRVHNETCPANWKAGQEGMPESLEGVKSTIG